MKIRTYRLLAASLAATLCVAVAACSSKPKHDNGVSVSVKGGTYHFGAMTIQAPAGAVTSTTKLSVSTPHQLAKSSPAPLASFSKVPAVAFDVALAHGQEPRKPLQMSIPLAGSYLPKGASPSGAVLYTADGHGGYELVPATIDGKHVLHAQLAHLSPKWLAFLDMGKRVTSVVSTLTPSGIAKSRPKDCAKQATVSGTTVQLGGSAWSDKTFSPLHPCLVQDKGQLALKTINNSYIMWSVATSSGTKIVTTTDNAETEVIKLLAAKLYPEQNVQAYMARQSTLQVTLPNASIPAAVNFKASPSTTLAEADWIAFNLLTELFTGTSGTGALHEVEKLLDAVSVVSCLQSAMQAIGSGSFVDHVLQFFDVATGRCGRAIAEAVGSQLVTDTSDLTAWNSWWKEKLAVLSAAKNGYENLMANAGSILQQFSGVIVVTIRPTTPTCPS